MEYRGKLYGKVGNMYFDTGKTYADWDELCKKAGLPDESAAPIDVFNEIDPRVIQNYLIENGQLEYAEGVICIADELYKTSKELKVLRELQNMDTPAPVDAQPNGDEVVKMAEEKYSKYDNGFGFLREGYVSGYNYRQPEVDALLNKVDNYKKALSHVQNVLDESIPMAEKLESENAALKKRVEELEGLLNEASYRLAQAIDIFNGSSGLQTGPDDKYIKMVECADKIQKSLNPNNH